MICKCGGTLKITHTYDVSVAKTSTARCMSCPATYTLVTFILNEAEYGEGAVSAATKLRNGHKVFGEIKKAQPVPDTGQAKVE